jgi:2-oxoglutarate dehydrogenase E1 component
MNSIPVAARANSDLIEAAYSQWLDNPDSVDPTWRAFFQGFTLGNSTSSAGAKPTAAAA